MNKLSRKDIAMLELLAVTEESEGKLAEYVQQQGKAAKAYKAFREAVVNGVGVEKVVKEKTPNELRAEVIQRAKAVLIEWKDRDGSYLHPSPYGFHFNTRVEFKVNAEKRVVVALLRNLGITENIRTKGIAKCHPDDAFNEHISKAIALGRALGKDVSEFENAPQPTEPVVGHVAKGREVSGPYRQERKFTLTSKRGCDAFYYAESEDDFIYNWQIGDITDDTDAIYEGGC